MNRRIVGIGAVKVAPSHNGLIRIQQSMGEADGIVVHEDAGYTYGPNADADAHAELSWCLIAAHETGSQSTATDFQMALVGQPPFGLAAKAGIVATTNTHRKALIIYTIGTIGALRELR
ncbi:MAG: hypothetical protein OXI90_17520 [Gammaproteobacteria bacterium]|nr:hypothetical protein [Gammaproteobacteria bacterium]